MKEFIEKVLLNQQVNLSDLSKFIIEYSELCGIKNTTPAQLNAAVQLISAGVFDLKHACKMYANKIGLQITEVCDSYGNVIKVIVN